MGSPIENVIVEHSQWKPEDIVLLFGTEAVHYTSETMLPNLLKELGIFKYTSEAIRAGRKGSIPVGWSEIKASKKRRLWIWNPDE